LIEFLKDTFIRLLADTQTDKHRYIFDTFNINSRLTGIIGPRGVGKTTVMLQYIKEKLGNSKQVFYASADNIYFSSNTLLGLVDTLYQTEGVHYFFIDEIHKYPNWNQELKNIYDSFPNVYVVFSGSSSLDLVKGSYDLSRRATLFHLEGLSFREYLNFTANIIQPVITLDELLNETHDIAANLAKIPRLKGHFNEYLLTGYYPFVFEDPQNFNDKLLNIIDKSIYEDIAKFYNLKTQNLIYFKRILNFFASIPPGEHSINNLAKNMQIDFKTTEHYLSILTDVGLTRFIYPPDGGSRGLQKPAKMFINNTTLLNIINQALGEPLSIGTVRELFFIQSVSNARIPLFYSSVGDYTVEKNHFEIGGKNKSNKQIKNTKNSYLVKDDILHPSTGVLPLWIFGLLY
jgi:predicted AAA+ superfamily ATPase